MVLSAPVFILKQQAKDLSRREKIPLHEALDRIANREGFRTWSLLAARARPETSAARLYDRLRSGDLVLVGGRPGQGKTLLGMGLALESVARGNRAALFTLEFTEADVARCLVALNAQARQVRGRLLVDTSDGICADYINARLEHAPPGTLAVIDYLQLLDQKRDHPPLEEQVAKLKQFARSRQLLMVCLSQIDRRFDANGRSCPGPGDVRLPNPLDLTLFDAACFLNRGAMQLVRPVGPRAHDCRGPRDARS